MVFKSCIQNTRRNYVSPCVLCSLLNYAVFQGAFYCKVCAKILAEVIGKTAPNTTLSPNHQQLPLKDPQPNPRQESKSKSGPSGRILAREKMPQRPSNLHLQGNQSNKVTSQDKLKTICSPSKKEAKDYRKHERYGTKEIQPQDSPMVLHGSQKSGGSNYKTWGDNSMSESLGQQKKNQLPRVIGPKCGDRILHWIKKGHGNQELGALENRQLFVDEGIVGVQVGKIGSRVLEKTRRFQSSTSEVERSISKATLLSLNLPRSSFGGPFLTSEGAFRHSTVTSATTTLDAPQLAKDHFQGKKLGGDSTWKVTSDGKNPGQTVKPLPKVRTMLPALVPPLEQRSKKKLQKASQENTLDTLKTKDAEEPNYNIMVPKENEKPSQSKREGLVSSPGQEEKKNDQTEPSKKTLASHVDPVKPCLKTKQEPKPSWTSRNEFLEEVSEILQPEKQPSMDNQLLPLNEEDKKNDVHHGGISDSFVTRTCFSVSLDTEARGQTSFSAKDGNIEDGCSLSSSQVDGAESREVLSRNSLQERATLICNPEPTLEITNTNEKLQTKASNGPNLELAFQEDISRDISLLSSAKDPEILPSCEIPHLIEKQETGHVTMEIRAQHESVQVMKTSQDAIAKPSRKQPLKKQNNPFAQFFAPKTQRSISSQKPISGTKKAPKSQSALLTLFGHSVNKDKSQKKWPRKDLEELAGKVNLQSTHFSSLPKSDFSKKDENFGVVLQTRDSETRPQDSEESHGIGSKGNPNRNSPHLDSVNTVSLELGREISSPTRLQFTSKSLDIPKQSNINAEHTVEEPEKSLPLTNFQSCVMSIENMSQYSANTLTGASVSCRNTLSEQEVDSQDLAIKAGNVSSLDPLAKEEAQALDEENWVSDTLSSFKGTEESASREKENAESFPGSDAVHMKDHFCSGSSENFLGIRHPQFAELEPNLVLKKDSLRSNQPPENGNFQALESNSDHRFELSLHVEQATNENYSIQENHFHPALIPIQSMPELLRDTLQCKATERPAEKSSRGPNASVEE